MNAQTHPAQPAEPTPVASLRDVFTAQDILVSGTVAEPLFHAPSIAKHIKDANYRRFISKYDNEEVVRPEKPGSPMMLTEAGLYRYLTQSKLPLARPFQRWVTRTLIEVRQKTVSDALVAAKIAGDELAVLQSLTQSLQHNMDWMTVSFYDDTRGDSCSLGLAEFYIARFFASVQFNTGEFRYRRESLPEPLFREIRYLADLYWRKPQRDFKELVEEKLRAHYVK